MLKSSNLVAILLATALTACSEPRQPQFNHQSPELIWQHSIFVARSTREASVARATLPSENAEQNEGRFEVNNGCLVFEGSNATWLVVFPSSAKIVVWRDHIVFGENRIDFKDEFLLSGEPSDLSDLEPLVAPIPAACSFPLWKHF
jgi:hypothetical protein